MNSALYFENNPWEHALQLISDESLGEIVQVSLQVVSEKRKLKDSYVGWKLKLGKMLGTCIKENLIECENAFSFIGRYENDAIVRIFIDQASFDIVENFEIVTKESLIIWKPNVHPQGRTLIGDSGFYHCTQPYSIELEVKQHD